MSHFRGNFKNSGFTLIELLVVIAIIGVLASVVLGALSGARDKALIAKAQSELRNIYSAMEILYSDTGVYPNGSTSACRSAPPANNEINLSANAAGLIANGSSWTGWQGPYMVELLDPWGTAYYMDEDYECQGTEIGCGGTTDTISAIISCGPDTDVSGSGGACAYNADNIVLELCQ